MGQGQARRCPLASQVFYLYHLEWRRLGREGVHLLSTRAFEKGPRGTTKPYSVPPPPPTILVKFLCPGHSFSPAPTLSTLVSAFTEHQRAESRRPSCKMNSRGILPRENRNPPEPVGLACTGGDAASLGREMWQAPVQGGGRLKLICPSSF